MISTSAVMLCCAAEVEHLLRLGDAANRRAGEAAASHDEAESGDGQRFLGRADQGDVAVAREQVDVGIDVVLGGDAIEDEVEAARVLLHLVGVAGDRRPRPRRGGARPLSCSARW